MPDMKRVLPKEVHFTTEACQILADMNSHIHKDYFELLKRYPYADGLRDISICQSAQPTDAERLIDEVRKGNVSWIGIGWLIFITTFANAARKKGMTPLQYADWIYDQCNRINDEVGYRAAWIEAFGEIGNSVTWPQGKTFSKKEALEYFRSWLRDGRSLTEHWRSVSPPETLSYFTHAKRRDENLRNLPIYYSEGTLYSIHEAFRNGFPLVAYEGACGSADSFQTGIAFVRGGAKMYDALWGIDLSPWGGYMNGYIGETNNSGTWDSSMTPDLFYRIWITSYMSGCNTLLHEVGYCFFYTYADNDVQLSDFGYKAMHFHRLTKECLKDRGQPVVPFAVMLEEEHGYRGSTVREFTAKGELITSNDYTTAKGRLCIWANRTPELTKGDWHVQRTISALFPYSDNLWTQFYGQWPDERSADHEAMEPHLTSMIQVGEIDPRETSPYLRDSTWADCFDVIIEDTAEDVLNKYYKAILLAGDIQTDNGLWDRLNRYMDKGGSVVLTVEHLDGTALKDLGLILTHKPQMLNVNWMLANGQRFAVKQKTLLHAPTCDRNDVKVWATDEKTAQPLVLEYAKGQGRAYIVLAAHGMDKDGKKLSRITAAIIDHLYAKCVGITREGEPCQMLVNTRNDDTLVTLLNHTSKDWHGHIHFDRANYPAVAEVRDVIQDRPYPVNLVKMDNAAVTVTVRIPAFEAKIIAFGPKRERVPFKGPLTTTQGLAEDDTQYLTEIVKKGPKAVIGTV